MKTKERKTEFGDFQTPYELAIDVASLVRELYPSPSIIVEPACGSGSFIKASLNTWHGVHGYYGFDINQIYIEKLRAELGEDNECHLEASDFFTKDWKRFFFKKDEKWLIIGNPPWVTNAALGVLKSNNLPNKSNLGGLNGFEAKTGKANFDIAEWMLIKLIDSLAGASACLAMLCKTATARKVLRHFWNADACIYNSSIHKINAEEHFGVAVDACLFLTFIGDDKKEKDAELYSDLTFTKKTGHLGIIGNELVANMDIYKKYQAIDGKARYGWRSGIKHDAAKVMELEKIEDRYINGFNDEVCLEDEYIYPLLKSSDIANQRLEARRYVIVTQKTPTEDTSRIEQKAPRTWAYLNKYRRILDGRKSIIYKKRPRFSVFGIGDYSFTPWKAAISGLYKKLVFAVVGTQGNKPVMLDDTCYFLPCQSEEEANLICDMLNSKPCAEFIKSLIFFDSKRPVTIDLLKRIDIYKLAEINKAHNIDAVLARKKEQEQLVMF